MTGLNEPVDFRAPARNQDSVRPGGHRQTIDAAAPTASSTTTVPTRWSAIHTDWPQVGGRSFRPAPRDAFLADEYRARYQPGETRAIYVATSIGARALAETIKMPLGKVSTTRDGRLQERLREQGGDGYGAGWYREGRLVVDSGWKSWDAVLMRPSMGPSPGSPVVVTPRAILVALPDVLPAYQFDDLWDAQTRLAAIDRWAETEEGLRHFGLLGVDPAVARRKTIYRFDTSKRVSAVHELCCFRLSQDPDRLIAVAEKIILRALGLVD